jgi:hypothetical protein
MFLAVGLFRWLCIVGIATKESSQAHFKPRLSKLFDGEIPFSPENNWQSVMEVQHPFRVTRLGEFSPIGRLNTLGIFVKITEIFGLLFSRGKSCLLIFTKNGLGYILGDFFTNASGHPASIQFFRPRLKYLEMCVHT